MTMPIPKLAWRTSRLIVAWATVSQVRMKVVMMEAMMMVWTKARGISFRGSRAQGRSVE